MAVDVRTAAARTVGRVLEGRSLNQVLPAALESVASADRALLQQLCYGSLRQGPLLRGLVAQMLDKPLKERDSDVEGLLLIGLYQLEGTRIPPHAAVAETVNAARKLKKPWAKGLCNALLRRYLRDREQLLGRLDAAQQAAQPAWLYRELQAHWPEQLENIVAANNQQPPMTLRVNQRLSTCGAYLQQLESAGLQARQGRHAPQALYLEEAVDVHMLPGFTTGSVSVQDEAAQLAAALVAAQPGDRVLDACAAPGGKSCHILEGQPQVAELVAADINDSRLEKVRENLHRLNLDARCLSADASAPANLAELAPFDRILVDAPCSATGVIRRHPDIKLLRRQQDIASLAKLQRAILEGLWPLLLSGGRLVYATCSVLPQENDAVVAAFLERHADATNPRIDGEWGVATRCGRQLLPEPDGPDGLYYALLEKA